VKRLCSALLASLCLLQAGSVLAWDAHEHAEIGAKGYLLACAQMRESSTGWPQVMAHADLEAARSRLAIVCPEDEWRRKQRAASYGQMVAISGDHLESPEEFRDKLQGRSILSTTDYGILALDNHSHFEPISLREWRRQRNKALAEAERSASLMGAEAMDVLDFAIARQAFADHFLEDSFAAGHIGINRAASGPGAAWVFHNFWNQTGRKVKDGFPTYEQTERTQVVQRNVAKAPLQTNPAPTTPEEAGPSAPACIPEPTAPTDDSKEANAAKKGIWVTFGDGQLERCKCNGGNSACWDRVVSSQRSSIYDLFTAFVLGKRDGDAEVRTEMSLPLYAYSPRVVHTFYTWNRPFMRSQDELNNKNADHWSTWTPTTHTSRPAYRSAEAFLAYERNSIVEGPNSLVLEAADGVIPASAWWRAALGVSLDFRSQNEEQTIQGATYRFKPFLAHLTDFAFAQGVINHEAFLGEVDLVWRPRREDGDRVGYLVKPAGYRLNLEFGKVVLHGDIGLATGYRTQDSRDDWHVGYVTAAGVSYVFSASGGGNWHGAGK